MAQPRQRERKFQTYKSWNPWKEVAEVKESTTKLREEVAKLKEDLVKEQERLASRLREKDEVLQQERARASQVAAKLDFSESEHRLAVSRSLAHQERARATNALV